MDSSRLFYLPLPSEPGGGKVEPRSLHFTACPCKANGISMLLLFSALKVGAVEPQTPPQPHTKVLLEKHLLPSCSLLHLTAVPTPSRQDKAGQTEEHATGTR